jgi:hypothetical protein
MKPHSPQHLPKGYWVDAIIFEVLSRAILLPVTSMS